MKLWYSKHNHHWNVFDGYSVLCAVDSEQQAEHIVHCVNNMPKLVEALGGLIDMWDAPPIDEWEKSRTLLSTLEAEKGGEL